MVATKSRTATKPSNRKAPKYSAADEFRSAATYMKGKDIENAKRKLRGAHMTIEAMQRVEFDTDEGKTDVIWLMHTDKFDLPFRVNITNGRSLAEEFGNDIKSWEGSTVAVTANKTSMGFGVVIEAIDDDEKEVVPFADDAEEEEGIE